MLAEETQAISDAEDLSAERRGALTESIAARPLRLLFVVNDPGFFLSHRLPIAAAARARGYDVHVATHAGAAAQKILAAGLTFHPVPITRRGVGLPSEMRSVAALYRLYRAVRPDIVHHVTIKPVLYGSFAARLASVPAVVNAVTGLGYVFTADGVHAAVLRGIVRRMYRVAFRHPRTRVIFQNPDDRDLLLTDGSVREETAVLIRGSGVNLDEFVPLPEPGGVPTVVLASRMLWHKGVGEFVEAADRLRRDGVRVRCVLVGETDPGNPAAVPRSQLETWNDSGVVEWWGHRQDMPAVLARSHVACLPSAYGEGVPKVLIEAAAAGRPIVTTDSAGCREIVRHGENGLLVPVRDATSLANAIRSLLEAPERRRAMGARGRDLAKSEFSLERVVSETLTVYSELLS